MAETHTSAVGAIGAGALAVAGLGMLRHGLHGA